jgi:dephospho-CoA kinase
MDLIAREIVEPGQPGLQAVKEAFGPSVVDLRGRLKRAHLRALIFSDEKARKTLESILHPLIRHRALEDIQNLSEPYCILVIPLLSDRSVYTEIDHVLVVDVDPKTQIERLMARDASSREQAERALASQINREQRLAIADDLLKNSGTKSDVRDEVARLHQKYLKLAGG